MEIYSILNETYSYQLISKFKKKKTIIIKFMRLNNYKYKTVFFF